MLIQSITECAQSETIVQELGYLPLAIEQAGAYIWAHGSALDQYLAEYKTNFQAVMQSRPEGLDGYATVYTTWQISLEAIKAENLQASQLLLLYGFLSNDVSDDMILHGEEGQIFEANDRKGLQICTQLLLSYSLVKREGNKYRAW